MHHQPGRKERRQQIDDRDRQEAGDQQAGGKDGAAMLRPEGAGLRWRPEAHGRELEEFPSQKVAVHQKEGDEVDAGNEQEQQRENIADDDHADHFIPDTPYAHRFDFLRKI